MKVAVYTIALNEAKHAERWANSAEDADYRVVADTGSTDDTVERLERAGVTVHRIAIRPWRFDVARNTALALIPADVDVCLSMDMDEFIEPGWRPQIEAAWTPGTTAGFCRKQLRSRADDPRLIVSFPVKNFHSRWAYRFKRPVHEELAFAGDTEVTCDCAGIIINHPEAVPSADGARPQGGPPRRADLLLARTRVHVGQPVRAGDRGDARLSRAAFEHLEGGTIRGDAVSGADATRQADAVAGPGPD
jgi:glycosyltransferase involved in cell wall biosynthesis